MKLHDEERLELNELCGAVVDGTLGAAQRERLNQLLRNSETARRQYVRAMAQSASLHDYAAEVHADRPDRPRRIQPAWHAAAWRWGAVGAAAAVALAAWLGRPYFAAGEPSGRATQFVARVTGAKDAQWANHSGSFPPGAHLRRGQQLELESGFAEITFDSGARVVLEGAATLDINSAWAATLRQGVLKASVPPEAIGFRISNPAVEVVDLGTEFTMIADGRGAAEVLVLKGGVEAASRMSAAPETIVLREKEARRFASTGMSDVADSEKKFALFAEPLSLERVRAPVAFVHWSFNESGGTIARADAVGIDVAGNVADMKLEEAADPEAAHPRSPRGHSLLLDGRHFARGRFPGISGAGGHTVAFWVKVPEDAPLSEAYTMVAWATNLPKLSYRPVQVSWNRRPEEGALGALRTDFGGGWAIGTTSLRDGRWHHVAVYFAVGDNPDSPVQVKQYIDGRLESSTINLGRTRAIGSADPAMKDSLWLGRRLTGPQKYPERFRGEIDELFVTARALEPNEIVTLMKENRLAATDLAAAR